MTNENKEVNSNNTEQNKATMKTYRDFALNALKDKPTSLAKMIIKEKIWIIKLLTDSKLCSSNGEARRMLKQNAVSIDGEKVTNLDQEIFPENEMILKVGKRRFLKLIKG